MAPAGQEGSLSAPFCHGFGRDLLESTSKYCWELFPEGSGTISLRCLPRTTIQKKVRPTEMSKSGKSRSSSRAWKWQEGKERAVCVYGEMCVRSRCSRNVLVSCNVSFVVFELRLSNNAYHTATRFGSLDTHRDKHIIK